MSYDASFAQTRLDRLAGQLLSGTNISGDILFIADDEDGGVLGSTWMFEDEDSKLLKELNFKFMLMELLNVLIRYRASHNDTDTLCGVIRLSNSEADLQWLPEAEVQNMRGAV
ncbi:hypothetical protein [Marinobacter shengliensis]|uniref:hypothetical protein n=1 Tax=Marinobacter shengliensis TaxID=1389223 RepID=UPI001108C1AD|nr:hypothetical protein [Marinobacter shengliensis]